MIQSDKIQPITNYAAIEIINFTDKIQDDFKRTSVAEKMVKLLRDEKINISPMVIDGCWGTGKTVFCGRLMKLMKSTQDNKHNIIYVDAFKADHAHEPLLTILAEVLKVIPVEDIKAKEKFIEKVTPYIRIASKLFATVVPYGTVIVDCLNEILRERGEACVDLENLKTELKSISSNGNPIVIFIDELDRCKPDFAIHMLEVIKHVFDVPNVQFVLICNTEQLKASIKHCYGSAVDAQSYLDKFLKFSFTLPRQCLEHTHQMSAAIKHYQKLINNSSSLKKTVLNNEGQIFIFIRHILQTQKFSLREIETFIRYLNIYEIITPSEEKFKELPEKQLKEQEDTHHLDNDYTTMLKLTGILLFCFRPKLAHDIVHNQLDALDLCEFFGEKKIASFTNEYRQPQPHKMILAKLGQECQKNAELFMPACDKEKLLWNNLFKKNKISSYDEEPYSSIVIKTIKIINLNDNSSGLSDD